MTWAAALLMFPYKEEVGGSSTPTEEPSVILVFSSFAFAVAVAAVGPAWRRGTQARSSPGLPRFRLCGGHRQLINSRSGYGWSHGMSAKDCILVRRRELRRTMSKHTFVAMRFSHERNNEPPSKLSRLRRARRNVSWPSCSASSKETIIRQQWTCSSRHWRSVKVAESDSSPATATVPNVSVLDASSRD